MKPVLPAVQSQYGGTLILTLVFFILLVVIASAWLSFAIRQHKVVVDQEQEEQSFQLSEAGVHYVLHLLNDNVCTPAELDADEPIIQSVAGTGTFETRFTVNSVSGGVLIDVQSLGYDAALPGRCQRIDATLKSFSGELGTLYRILSWDHRQLVPCGAPGPAATPSC